MSISFVQRTSHLSRFNCGFQQNSRASARVSLVRRFVPRALLLIARHLQIVNSFILSIHSVETSLLSQSYFLIYLFSFIYFPFMWTWGLDSCYWRKASLTPKTLHPLDQDALFRIRLWTLRFRWDLQVIPLLLWYVDTSTFFWYRTFTLISMWRNFSHDSICERLVAVLFEPPCRDAVPIFQRLCLVLRVGCLRFR